MELDEYKTVIQEKPLVRFHIRDIPALETYLQKRADSQIESIKKNLKLEISFALVFLLADGYMLLFTEHNYLRVFAFLLFVFCIYFIYYLVKLLRFIQLQQVLVNSVKLLLENYISIIHRFTRLYFQLTMIMIPLMFALAFISGYLDYRSRAFVANNSFLWTRIWMFSGLAASWSLMMYFFTRWYIRRLYGNYLKKLKEQLAELQDGK